MMKFLGHTAQYWLELQTRFDDQGELGAARLLEEIVRLRGDLDFLKSRIREMASVVK